MRRLEAALGFPLFERTGRSARLNAAGLRTLSRAEEICAGFDALGEPARDGDDGGTLRIGAIASVQATILARALAPFRNRFPRCRIHLSPGVSLHLMDRIDMGELDLAILIRPTFDPPRDLDWTLLVREDYALIVPGHLAGDDPVTLLTEQPFIRYDRASLGGRQVDRLLRNRSIRPRESIEVDDIRAMVSMAATGLGVAIVPMSETILPLPCGVRAIPLGPDAIHREIGILHRAAAIPDVAAALVECLLQRNAG